MTIQRKADLLSGAYTGGIEVSVTDLCSITGKTFEAEIDCWIFVNTFLLEHGLILVPPLTEELSLDRIRLLKTAEPTKTPEYTVRKDLFGLETNNVEYKSSLFFDYNRFKSMPDTEIKDLKADFVTESVLKTIAAFLNAEGGRLYIGVNDDGVPIGLEPDLTYTKKGDYDSWMLSLNALVRDRFKDGKGVSGHLTPEYHDIDGKRICQVSVRKRIRPSYLKKYKDGRFALFRRLTGETEEIGVEDVEEFFLSRGWTAP